MIHAENATFIRLGAPENTAHRLYKSVVTIHATDIDSPRPFATQRQTQTLVRTLTMKNVRHLFCYDRVAQQAVATMGTRAGAARTMFGAARPLAGCRNLRRIGLL